MKTPLAYLTLTRFKNTLLQWVKSPAKLIYALFLIACLGLVFFSGQKGGFPGGMRDSGELHAAILVLFTMIYVIMAWKGFSGGASFFERADVNLIFPSPIKPRTTLFYGLIRQAFMSLLLGLFIPFQYSWLHQLYGIDATDLVWIFLGYALIAFLGQVTAMVIYSRTSSDEKKGALVKRLLLGVYLIFAGVLVAQTIGAENPLTGVLAALDGYAGRLLPVSGWVASLVDGVIYGDAQALLIGALLSSAGVAGLIALLLTQDEDFYEDVLQSTELQSQAREAAQEGRLTENAPREVKVGKTGLGRGWGADAVYYKHLLENRRGRVLLFPSVSWLFLGIGAAMAFFMKDIGIVAIFSMNAYFQLFMSALGRFNRELTKPYIYLIPEKPYVKLLQALRESLPTVLLESVVLYVAIGLIMALSVDVILLCILCRVSFGLVFTAANVTEERIFGGIVSRPLMMLFYMLCTLFLLIPGGIAAWIVAAFTPLTGTVAVLTGLTIGNIPTGFLLLYLCRSVLVNTEYQG